MDPLRTDPSPLSSRVDAPVATELPEGFGLRWRPAVASDVETIHACVAAMDPVDHPDYVTPREEVAEDLAHSYVDLEQDTVIGVADDGRVLAFGFVIDSPGRETIVRSILVGGVHPEARGRGIGRELLRWQQERGMQQLAASDSTLPGWLVTYAEERARDAVALYIRAGFTVGRYFLQVVRDLRQSVVPRSPAEGIRVERFRDELSELTRLSKNDSFRDHWGSQPNTEEQWASFVTSSVFRPDLSFVAVAADETGADVVAGFCLVSVNPDDWAARGKSSAYIDLVGVGRAWRGRGIAPALLSATLAACSEEGLDLAVLDVDSDSPTGALGFYTGVGFVEESRSVNFIREF